MAGALWTSELCEACRYITYKMFAVGFEHSLTFEETVDSGDTCKFCRLMVCTFSKVQVKDWNLLEIDQHYGNWAEKLKQLLYIAQNPSAKSPSGMIQGLLLPPEHLRWARNVCTKPPYLNRNFNDGSTIQLSAPKGERYVNRNTVVLDCFAESMLCRFSLRRSGLALRSRHRSC
jgi:hypothetical protein